MLGFLFVILLVIPITVFLVGQQQNLQSKASPNTTLSFVEAEKTAAIGDQVSFDIWISPGQNTVNFVKLVIKFDATKLKTKEENFVVNPASNLSILEGPVLSPEGNELSVNLSIENNPTKVITQDVKIGTITFEALEAADPPTEIAFDDQKVEIRSTNGEGVQDGFKDNVFLNGIPAKLTIQGEADVTPTITQAQATVTPATTVTLTSSPTPTSTSSGQGATPGQNQSPVCESMVTDRSTEGTAPLSITFTVNGSDTDGTIDKATFSFGDGTVEDVITGGGIGTTTVNVQKSFTYNNAGSFTASALLTDNNNGVSSDSTSCATTITVSDGSGGTGEGATPLDATGPTETIFGVGALGGILFFIGALLFFAL